MKIMLMNIPSYIKKKYSYIFFSSFVKCINICSFNKTITFLCKLLDNLIYVDQCFKLFFNVFII